MAKRVTPDGKYINAVASSIKDFQRGLPSYERKLLEEFQDLVRRLDFDWGRNYRSKKLTPSVTNMRKLNAFSKEFREIVVQSGWGNNTAEMIKNLSGIEKAAFEYFAHVSSGYTPSQFSDAIKAQTIESLRGSLLGSGIDASVISRAQSLMYTSITENVTFAELQRQMKDFIIGTGNGGILQRYARQIITDSANQYAAQLNKTFTDDLNLQWYRYAGSLVTDSRDWCEAMVAKQWIHSSELPAVTEGKIDGRAVPLTGLMPGTNAQNVQVRRGGYNCNHMLLPVAEESVPIEVRAKFDKSLADKVKKKAERQEKMRESSRNFGKKWGYTPENLRDVVGDAEINEDVFKQLSINTRLNATKRETNYIPGQKIVNIDTTRFNKETISRAIYHEFGHAAHDQRRWLYRDFDFKKGKASHFVVPEIEDVFLKWRKKMGYGTKYTAEKGKFLTELQDTISHTRMMGFTQTSDLSPAVIKEDWGAMNDVIGSLTNGRYGWGHSKSYYSSGGGYGSRAEFVAHAWEFKYAGNEQMKRYFPELYQDMIDMANKLIALP